MLLTTATSTNGYILTSEINVMASGATIPGATVVAQWTDPNGGITEQTAPTNAAGVAAFTRAVGSSGTYTLAVANIVLADFTYDDGGNTISSTSITLRPRWSYGQGRGWWDGVGRQR